MSVSRLSSYPRAAAGILRIPGRCGLHRPVLRASARRLSTADAEWGAAPPASPPGPSSAVWHLGPMGEPYSTGQEQFVRTRVGEHAGSSLNVSGKPRRLMSEGVLVPEELQPVPACVLVSNLPSMVLPEEVEQVAGPDLAGEVDAVELLYDRTAKFRGEAVVTLRSPKAASLYATWTARALVSGRALRSQVLTLGEGKDLVFPFDAFSPKIKRHNGLSARSLFASYLISRFGGRVVAFGGLPRHVRPFVAAQMLWHGGWALEPRARSPEWNLLLTRLYYRMRAAQNAPDRYSADAVDLVVRSSRDSGARSRGLALNIMPTEDGLIDAGHLDPIFFFNPVMDLTSVSHLVVMASEAEAHRFCTRFHKQPFDPSVFGWSRIAYARILH